MSSTALAWGMLGLLSACGSPPASSTDLGGDSVDVRSSENSVNPEATTSANQDTSEVRDSECVTRATGGLGNDFVKTNGVVCDPEGFAFVRSAVAISIGEAEILLRQPEQGSLCVKGTASTTELAWGLLGLEFSAKSLDQTEIFSTFDAQALGITQLAFTLTGAPNGGLLVDSASTIQLSCPGDPGACQTPDEGFLLMTEPGSSTVVTITEDGDYIAPFANFQQTRPDGSAFDTTRLEHFSFRTVGEFDFCISHFRLLNADNESVTP